MQRPIQATLAYFTKICYDKKVIPCFDMRKINDFFYSIDKEYPDLFEYVVTPDNIHDEMSSFEISRIIQSIFPNLHPHFMTRAGLLVYEKHKHEYSKEIPEIAQKFYDKLSCDLEGRLGKHTVIEEDD